LAFSALLWGADEKKLLEKAKKIHEEVTTIDTHNDTVMGLDRFDLGLRHEPRQRGSGQQDFIRMKEGGLDASFMAVYVNQGPLTDESYARAKEVAVHGLDNLDLALQKYPQLAEKATTPADLRRLQAAGKRAIFVGMENGYPLGLDLANLDHFAGRGVRYVTLCHSGDNQFADSATDRRAPEDRGLSELGRQLVRRMNRLGILVDVSHMSDKSFFDLLAESKVPVFASHSSCRALCDIPRNISDEMLLALKKNGGVIQICVLGDFLKKPPENPERDQARADLFQKFRDQYGSRSAIQDPAVREQIEKEFHDLELKYPRQKVTVKELVDHIDHVVRLIGIDHVGIGTDFDGGGGIDDVNDITEMPNITVELLRRGYSKAQIAKIWGGNFLRVFQSALDYAAAAKAKGE
jgi:membrane dipeptidase